MSQTDGYFQPADSHARGLEASVELHPRNGGLPNDAAQKLSQSVFANPQEFIEELESMVNTIPHAFPNLLIKNDLENYSQIGLDAKARAAAKIAADHFDQLKDMAKIPNIFDGYMNDHKLWDSETKISGISRDDLEIDMDMLKGKTSFYIGELRTSGYVMSGFAGLGTVVFGAASCADWVAPPMAGLTLLGAGASAIAAGSLVHRAAVVGREVRDLSKHDQETLASWPEINGGKK